MYWGRKLVLKLTISVLGLALLWGIINWRHFMKWLYPVHYAEIIDENSRKHNLDPFLVTSIILVESNFESHAESVKGARGLMQLMPETANWIAEQMGHPVPIEAEKLFVPEFNVQLGTWYLASLYSQFGDWVVAVAAYNGGRGNVQKWLDEARWSGELDTISDIPFEETRSYVARVMQTHLWYKRIYCNNWREAMASGQRSSSFVRAMGKAVMWLNRFVSVFLSPNRSSS